jgi:hypothetical protein
MGAVGAGLGAPASFLLYRWMDAAAPGAGLGLAAGKFALDYAAGCVIWQIAYCALPGNEWYKEMLAGVAAAAGGRLDAGVRDAAAYAAAAVASVVPVPAPASV